ncbi:MAG: FAD-dependent thymidylate synthase [Candidatus Brocadiia bacterium]
MARIIVPDAEAILDREFKVLDHGFVRLVDYMGGDERIVAAARVSYGRGNKTFREDKSLINYLLRNDHTSPFEQVVLTFHCKMPIFVARQWVRHRTARLNEISGRYSVFEEDFYLPQGNTIRKQNTRNKQGRDDEEAPPELQRRVLELLEGAQKRSYEEYREMIDAGIARELARINLPLSLYTQWYWQMDLHNLLHFLKLRMDAHSQYEIRVYAETMAEITRHVAPVAYECFEEHVLHAKKMSRSQYARLKTILSEQSASNEEASKLLKELEG